jgi:hypothetical protein
LAVRHHGDVVLRVAAIAKTLGTVGHAAMAGPFVHRHEPVGERRDRLLPDSDGASGRGGNSSDPLTEATKTEQLVPTMN